MWRLVLICLFISVFANSAHALDFRVYDATVSGINIDVTGYLGSTSNYYLQGALRSTSGDYFFGETQNNKGDWIDYVSSPETEYIINNFYLTEPHNASWSNIIHLRFHVDDTNYKGPGEYTLELRRFTGSSKKSAGESDPLIINLSAPTPVPSPTPTPTPSPNPSPSLSPSPTPIPTPTPKPSLKPSPSPSPDLSPPPDGTVAGESTQIDLSGFGISPSPSLQGQSSQALKLNQARAKTALLVGSGLIISSLAGFLGYRKYLKSITISE
ncbi:MAG: hypothetical protein ABII21_01250 [bacterium]